MIVTPPITPPRAQTNLPLISTSTPIIASLLQRGQTPSSERASRRLAFSNRMDSLSSVTTAFMPRSIWRSIAPRTAAVSERDQTQFGSASLEEFVSICRRVSQEGSSRQRVVIHGPSVDSLAEQLVEKVKSCLHQGDFTEVMNPEIHFSLRNDDQTVRSLGDGVGRETFLLAYRLCTEGEALIRLLRPSQDDTYSISTISQMGHSRAREDDLGVLGFFMGHAISIGRAAKPGDPAYLHLLLNNCDIDSLTKEVVKEWHPQLCASLEGFIQAGPDGDIAPFTPLLVEFLGLMPAHLKGRDEAAHNYVASQILYTALIGSEPLNHKDVLSFLKGFRLPCRNGFDLVKVRLFVCFFA
ncbi:hypothetical protein OF83DRAFT_1179067 [Amylostereum chailletii]|nr:hypothetical protein OF83DRAFT_1179067 [Amylostereum chailletii]